jgi:DNA repair photolyase
MINKQSQFNPTEIPNERYTSKGRPVSWFVDSQVNDGIWTEQDIPAEIVGLSRSLSVFRAPRKTNQIVHSWHGDSVTFCPPIWWDLAIGSGACGLGCRACFLMLTHRICRDPYRHLLYNNPDDFVSAAELWLKNPGRRHVHTLGLGIDRSDSLLYEGVVSHARNLAPLFGNRKINIQKNKLILLTKTANTQYLAEIDPEYRSNIIVSFSLNPEPIADVWEGKWPDTLERITPSISHRLEAAKFAQNLGYEIRVRLDPIFTVDNWYDQYAEFISDVKKYDIHFEYWTLGTYREKNSNLDGWRDRWNLPPVEFDFRDHGELEQDGTHRHITVSKRIDIYSKISKLITKQFPTAMIGLCKETNLVRKSTGMCNAHCNCLI